MAKSPILEVYEQNNGGAPASAEAIAALTPAEITPPPVIGEKPPVEGEGDGKPTVGDKPPVEGEGDGKPPVEGEAPKGEDEDEKPPEGEGNEGTWDAPTVARAQDYINKATPYMEAISKAAAGDDDSLTALLTKIAAARKVPVTELVKQFVGSAEGANNENHPVKDEDKALEDYTDKQMEELTGAQLRQASLNSIKRATQEANKQNETAMKPILDKAQAEQAAVQMLATAQSVHPQVNAQLGQQYAGFKVTPEQIVEAMKAVPEATNATRAVQVHFFEAIQKHIKEITGPKGGEPAPELIKKQKANAPAVPDPIEDPVGYGMAVLGDLSVKD